MRSPAATRFVGGAARGRHRRALQTTPCKRTMRNGNAHYIGATVDLDRPRPPPRPSPAASAGVSCPWLANVSVARIRVGMAEDATAPSHRTPHQRRQARRELFNGDSFVASICPMNLVPCNV